MPKLYKEIIKIAVLGGLLVVVQAFAFTEPSAAPPGNNAPAPLNVGGDAQTKLGGLILNTGGAPNGLSVPLGNVGIGTLSPQAKLEVRGEGKYGTTIALTSPSPSDDATVVFNGSGTQYNIGSLTDSPIGDRFRIWTSQAGESFSIYPDGNVAIGCSAPYCDNVNSKITLNLKVKTPKGIDPPYVSFSAETHASIRDFAKSVNDSEKVMEFWNDSTHRMEIYVIGEDKFYLLTGESAGN